MRPLTTIAAIVLTLAAISPALAGIDIGPAVGSAAPAVTAVDGHGAARSLASIAGKNGTVLVFFRSARWCPYCQKQLIEFKAAAKPLAARGYALAALSYDPAEAQTAFATKQGLDYILLSDPKSATIEAWGLRDPQYPAGNFAYGVPKPAIFVVDARGVVRGKLAEDGYKVRPPVAAVLALVDGLAAK